MTTEQIEVKIQELTGELEKAEAQLAKLRPQVLYLEQMQQRLDGALVVLQGMLAQEKQAAVVARPVSPNSQAALPVGD